MRPETAPGKIFAGKEEALAFFGLEPIFTLKQLLEKQLEKTEEVSEKKLRFLQSLLGSKVISQEEYDMFSVAFTPKPAQDISSPDLHSAGDLDLYMRILKVSKEMRSEWNKIKGLEHRVVSLGSQLMNYYTSQLRSVH